MASREDPSAGGFSSEVQAGYDRWARVYDHDANPLPALEDPHVHASVGEVDGSEVLELGCGTGRHTVWLAAAGARVTALDFSEGMLQKAREKAPNLDIQFLRHDLHLEFPLEATRFDLVVSGLVLEHIVDLPAFFAEIHRVLRDGGRAVISAMHPAMFERGSQARFTDPDSGELVQPGSIDHSIADITRAVEGVGLELEELGEYAPDAEFALRFPRAAKYVDWPMLVVFRLRKPEP